jgi:hypothetical protein
MCLTVVLCLSAATLLSAQPPAAAPPAGTPPAGTPPAGGQRAAYVPKNLKVLPADTDLRAVMRGFTGALGVNCEFCHAQNPDTHRTDPPSDANPMKDTARYMIRMTGDLNTKYMAAVPNVQEKATIGCGTCHRGEKLPSAFVPPPRQPGNAPGAPPPAGMTPPPAPRPGM